MEGYSKVNQMTTRVISAILLLLFVFPAEAQHSFNDSTFKVTLEDLITNKYSKDSTAKALVIYEKGRSNFNGNTFYIETEIERKIKIFDKTQEENFTVSLILNDFDTEKDSIPNIDAATYNLIDNKIVKQKVERKDVFITKIDDKNSEITFTFPSIKKGSVITYRLKLAKSDFQKFYGWEFQGTVPKLYSEYRTSIPANFEYNIRLNGPLEFDKKKSELAPKCFKTKMYGEADCTNTIYIMRDIPAFIEEDYTSSIKNYLSGIEYELKKMITLDKKVKKISQTWEEVDKQFSKYSSVGKQLNKTSKAKRLISKELQREPDLLVKAQGIYKTIQENYFWNEEYISNEPNINKLVKEKHGSVFQINILLNNILNKYDIKSKLVLMSTRENGLATKLFPVITDFNYIIVQAEINGETYLLDATDKYVSFGELPFRCLNYYGRLLDFKNGSSWIDIKPLQNNVTLHRLSLKLTDEDVFSGTLNSKYQGHHATIKKKDYFPNQDNYLENFKNSNNHLEILEHKVKTEENTDKFFEEDFIVEYLDFNEVGNQLFFDPFLIKFFKENPFKLKERAYPIEFGHTNTFSYMAQFDLNNKYEIISIPEATIVSLPNNSGTLSFNPIKNENNLTIVLKVTLKYPVYGTEIYNHVKQFFNKIIDTQSKTLIELKRNN
jgi:hypothetical protein